MGYRVNLPMNNLADAGDLSQRVEALLLEAFEPDELAALSPDLRATLDVLVKRRLRQDPSEPSLAELLRIRQQFELYSESRGAIRLTAQLR